MKNYLVLILITAILSSCNNSTKSENMRKGNLDKITFKKIKESKKLELEYKIITENLEDVSFYQLHKRPKFPGGYDSLAKFIRIKYIHPDTIETLGDVKSTFIVNKQGKVTNVKIINGLRKEVDSACYNVISKIPNWKPAEYEKGEKVEVKFLLPLRFVSESEFDKLINKK